MNLEQMNKTTIYVVPDFNADWRLMLYKRKQ